MLETPGSRVRAIRSFCAPSRNQFCEQTGLSESTLKAWENDISPLTEKGALLLAKIFTQQKIFCTQSWLLHGEGLSPMRQVSEVQATNSNEEESILQEIEMLKKFYPKHENIIWTVSDNSMWPYYKMEDFVVGIQIKMDSLKSFVGSPLIFQTKDQGTLLRGLEKDKESLKLVSLQEDEKKGPMEIPFPSLKIKSIYQIIWCRRKLNHG